MTRRLLAAGALVLALALPTAALAAAPAVTVGAVNLRAGPSTGYPVVTVVPAGTAILTHGCLADYGWCDVGIGPVRGWMSARWIVVSRAGATVVLTPAVATTIGIGVVTFGKIYWDSHYAAYPWYRRWATYAPGPMPGPVPGPLYGGRVTSHARAVECADGSCTATSAATGWRGGSTAQTRACADGSCTATRETTGPRGGTLDRTRTCNGPDRSCSVTRTGPRGGTMERSRAFRH